MADPNVPVHLSVIPPVVTVRMRARRVLSQGIETSLAIASIVSAPFFLLDPRVRALSSIGREAGAHVAVAWTILYAVGGLLALIGLWSVNRFVESGGLSLLASATAIQAVAVVAAFGLVGISFAAALAAISCGFLARVYSVNWGPDRAIVLRADEIYGEGRRST